MRKFVVLFVILGLASSARAQQRGTPAAPPAPGTAFFKKVNVESEVVKGAPYSAEVVNESVQILPDGNRIVHRETSRVYRDSDGRTRREVDRPVVVEVWISDPVAERSYTLNLDARTARQNVYMPLVFNGTVNRTGELDALNVLINGQLASFVARGGNGGFVIGGPNDQTVEEKLSPKTIEGLRVEGIRRTMTIQPGAIGNERAIVVTSDQWTSPELKALVLSESNDPRTGTSTYKLVNVKRGDPPASLFQVPSDFTIVLGPAGGRGGRGVPETPGGARGR